MKTPAAARRSYGLIHIGIGALLESSYSKENCQIFRRGLRERTSIFICRIFRHCKCRKKFSCSKRHVRIFVFHCRSFRFGHCQEIRRRISIGSQELCFAKNKSAIYLFSIKYKLARFVFFIKYTYLCV